MISYTMVRAERQLYVLQCLLVSIRICPHLSRNPVPANAKAPGMKRAARQPCNGGAALTVDRRCNEVGSILSAGLLALLPLARAGWGQG